MYTQTTQGIKVTVQPTYLDEQSIPENDCYVWAYHIRIENLSQERVQLLSRHWEITNAQGKRQVVRGIGVIGAQPILEPGESFEYTSGVPLTTASGFMVGRYTLLCANNQHLDVAIPAFSLDVPRPQRSLN